MSLSRRFHCNYNLKSFCTALTDKKKIGVRLLSGSSASVANKFTRRVVTSVPLAIRLQTHPLKHLSTEKKNLYQRTSLIPCIISLQVKFCNCGSMVWARMQCQRMGKNYFLFGEGGKSYALFYMHFRTWFSNPAYCNSLRYRKLSQHLHVLIVAVLTRTFEVCSPRIYQSQNKSPVSKG